MGKTHKAKPHAHTAESQLIVHSLLSGTEREVRLIDSRNSVGVYDKSTPHCILYKYIVLFLPGWLIILG